MDRFCIITTFAILVSFCANTYCANIMLFTPLTSKSETNFLYPYAEALAAKGHKVTVVCGYPMKNKSDNIRHVNPPELQSWIKLLDEEGGNWITHRINQKYYDETAMMYGIDAWCLTTFKAVMIDSHEIEDMIKNKETFDLIIVNGVFNFAGLALASIFNCPFVYVDGAGFFPHQAGPTGNSFSSAVTPTIASAFIPPFSLKERIINTYMNYMWRIVADDVIQKTEDQLRPVYEKYGMVHSLIEVEKNVSLVLNYRHSSVEFPRAFYPNVVRIGCVHCRDSKPLPKEFTDFISQSGEHGFIIFSLGSVCRLHENKEFFRKNFFEAFAKMPQKFLVKWDANVTNEEIGAPSNVKIMNWLPLQDLITHPKCRAFISHCGLLSTMESMYHGVPVVSVPMFWDQDYNAYLLQKFGMGIKLEIGLITKEVMLGALEEITTNPSYRENGVRRSKIFRDHPMAPIDTMVYWTEYVIRHKGADHLRPIDAMNMPWYQLWMVDAVVIALVIILTVIFLFKKLLKLLFFKSNESFSQHKLKKN